MGPYMAYMATCINLFAGKKPSSSLCKSCPTAMHHELPSIVPTCRHRRWFVVETVVIGALHYTTNDVQYMYMYFAHK